MDKKRIIIHIGFPRCASTLLQREIFPRLEGDIRVVSPVSQDRRVIDFLNERFIFSGRNISMAPVSDGEKSRVAAIVAEYPESALLVSNEGLVGDSFDNMLPLPHLAGALRLLFGQPEVLLVIRRQSDMVKSYYRYALEEGFYKSFPAFLGYRNGRFAGFRLQRYAGVNVDPARLDFYNFVAYLETVFGEGNVHVLPYEWIKTDFSRFCSNLADMLGAKLRMTDSVQPVNRGVHGADFFLLRALNRLWATRILGFRLLPKEPFIEHLDIKCRDGGLAIRVLRAICVRVSPTGVLRVLSPMIAPLLNPLLSALAIRDLRFERQIAQAIDDAVFDSNVALNKKLGGYLTGLGYCDRG
jgi:hypothetical protein